MHYGKCAYRTTSSSSGIAPVTARLALDRHRGGGAARIRKPLRRAGKPPAPDILQKIRPIAPSAPLVRPQQPLRVP